MQAMKEFEGSSSNSANFSEKHWSESNRDIYVPMNYSHDFRSQTTDEWDDLVWLIQRGKVNQIMEELPINQSFMHNSRLRETGEQVLHVCAEYEDILLFDWFESTYNCLIHCLNDFDETPLMIAAREGKMKIVRLHRNLYMDAPYKL
jgi:hypothetical protein